MIHNFFFSWSKRMHFGAFFLYIFSATLLLKYDGTECELNGNKLYKNFNKIKKSCFFSLFFYFYFGNIIKIEFNFIIG